MNPDLANLLGALRDQPDDAIAYLALADWCLEQPRPETQARGEHVRLSMQLSQLLRKVDRNSSEARALSEQVKTLEKRHRAAWLGSMRSFAHRCDFVPGGLVKLEVSEGRLSQLRTQKVVPATREEFAWVSSIEARTLNRESLEWLGKHLPVGFLRTFRAWSMPRSGKPILEWLVRCPWAEGLRSLYLSQFETDAASIGHLGEHPSLNRLEELTLAPSGLRFDDLTKLAESPNLARLGHLALNGSSLAPHHNALPLRARWAESLRSLSLDSCALDRAGVAAICQSSFASRLEGLSLENNALGSASVGVLVSWPGLACLQRLNLGNTGLTDAGLEQLVGSPHLGQLRELRLTSNRYMLAGANVNSFGDAGLISLAASRGLPQLTLLDLVGNDRIDEAGLLALCRSETLPRLRVVRHSHQRLRIATQEEMAKRFGG